MTSFLGDGEAHLWCFTPGQLSDPVWPARCLAVLSPEERERYHALRLESVRREHLFARALVRLTLSRYVAVAPTEWLFGRSERGRPEIVAPAHALPLHFSLSHTEGFIVCLAAREREIGVDVEDAERAIDPLEIAGRYFAPGERDALRALAGEPQRRRFFEYWTLKEAYAKARGLGLALPLDACCFHLEAGEPVRVSFGGQLDDRPDCWQFERLRPTRRHLLGVALRRPRGARWTLRLCPADPG